MPGWQIPLKGPNNWQSHSSRRSIECRCHANTKPRSETLGPRISPKSKGRFCYHYAKLGNALAPYQFLRAGSAVWDDPGPLAVRTGDPVVLRNESGLNFPAYRHESRAANLRRRLRLPPYKPAAFSSTYSRILVRASGGSSGAANIRLMIDAERPEALWLALRMVQAVLRESPSALACSSSVRNPADLTASTSSLILENCRARWVRARAAENRRNASDECVSMHRFPLNWPHGALQSNVRCREQLLTD